MPQSSPHVVAVDFETLLAQARFGSTEALGKLLVACCHSLLRQARRQIPIRLHPKSSPADLVQETLLEAHRDFARFRGTTKAEFLAWLLRIVRTNCSNFRRQYLDTKSRQIVREVSLDAGDRKPRVRERLTANQPAPGHEILRREEIELVSHAVGKLPERYRRILQLRFYEEQPFVRIAVVLECSPDAARKLTYRALGRLSEGLIWSGSSR